MLTPMFLFTQMPTVISPQDDNRIVGMPTAIQGIKHPAYLGIGKADGGEIGLNRFAPLLVCGHIGMIPGWLYSKVPLTGRIVDFLGQLFAKGGNVLQIPVLYWRQLNLTKRMHVEIFLRYAPCQMWLRQSVS